MPSGSLIPRSLRPGPPSITSVPGSYVNSEHSIPDQIGPSDSSSIVDGMEHLTTTETGSGDVALGRSRTHRHHSALKAKSDAYVEYTDKTLAPEQTDFMIRSLESKADLRLKRTYVNGQPMEEVQSSAPVLTVGLKFLPGADKPQVSRTQ
ncbi:MAG: hypothetical protein Q9207_007413 [Kuettlingeria erythrocarpa]